MQRKASAVWQGDLKSWQRIHFDRQRHTEANAVFVQHAV